MFDFFPAALHGSMGVSVSTRVFPYHDTTAMDFDTYNDFLTLERI